MTSTTHRHEAAESSGATVATTAVPAHRHGRLPVAAASPHRTVLGLSVRLIRRGALLLTAACAAYVALEVVSYRTAYPNGVSREQFAMFEDNPAVRMMQGVPSALDTAGGFTVWDGGWVISLILAVWALLTTSRLLRGEEDAERTDLVLAGPIPATHVTALSLLVIGAAAVLVGVAVAVAMAASGTATSGSILFGLGLTTVTATFAGVAAVTSQLVDVRRRAAALAAGALGVAYVLRMVGNSSDPRAWIRWTTPLGWMDVLDPYGAADLRALLPMLLVPFALVALAIALRTRRDTGGALLSQDGGHEPRLRMLGSPAAFAWRSNRGVLVAWILGLGAYSAVMGALISTMIDWLGQDESYQKLMTDMGFTAGLTVLGFLSIIGSMLGLAVALQVAWRLGAARAEEESGRADAILCRPVSRMRWLGGHAALALVGGVVLTVIVGTAVWVGAALAGSEEITWDACVRSVANVLPVVVLVWGLGVLAFGLLPRLTVAVPVTVAVVGYLLTVLGAALKWPSWVLDLSPYTHLALVPLDPWAATSGLVMLCLGLLCCAVGLLAFDRRDIVGD